MNVAVLRGRAPAGERMRWGSVLLGALVIAFVRPASWPVALAGFFARGGVILMLIPVLVIPTPTGVANAVGGPVSSFLFGAPSLSLVAVLVAGAAGVVALTVIGAVVAGWSERNGIEQTLRAAADEGLVPAPVGQRSWGADLAALTALRLLGLVPPAVALALSAPVLYDAAYRELILPDELRTPLALRILRDVPGTVLMVAATWLLADAAASLSIRRHVLEGRAVASAWAAGWVALVRRPVRIVGTALATFALTLILVGPAILTGALAWDRVRDLMREDRDPLAIVLAVVLFVTLWLGGLVLAAVAATFRAAAWTLDVVRVSAPDATVAGAG